MTAFAIKAAISDPAAARLAFAAQKTMYGGKSIAAGDTLYVIAGEHDRGAGLIARGTVTAAAAVPPLADVARQTPRVDVHVTIDAAARRPLGRAQLRRFTTWDDGRPETELNFKLYRQATNKIVGLSDTAAAFLAGYF